MDNLNECISAYGAWKTDVVRARQKVRQELADVVQTRADDMTKGVFDRFVESVRFAYETGIPVPKIRSSTCGTIPGEWEKIREAAGLPGTKRGRPRGEPRHGRTGTYVRGCRCEECTKAAREYQREYKNRKKEEGL